ncbi:acyltransferase family protein [Undibacterium sp.]|uniref:acyltransferase family protein n=1 Tax=Undibacterium sp. TaxID=1914977 RepID=UPI00374CFFA2
MQTAFQATKNFDQQDNLRVVDAFRGYAILMVMAAHSLPYVKDLIWPVKRLLLLGVYGVQLFFIASALTLLMSWARSRDNFGLRSGKFIIRRIFRIAPLYFLAILFYWLVEQNTAKDFSVNKLAASMLFYNSWSPYLIPTVPGWTPVPGGWSIGVEFCFYFIFPLCAIVVNNLKRSLLFIGLSLGALLAATIMGANLYPEISIDERANFLYFWPPNHLIIFALGFFLYQCLKSSSIRQAIEGSRISANIATGLLCIVIFGLSLYGQNKFFNLSNGLPPTHLLLSCALMVWSLVLICKPQGLAINRPIIALGKVSFSAYIVHFAVFKWTGEFLERIWPLSSGSLQSIAHACILIAIGAVITWYISSVTYKYIEQPFITLGKQVISNFSVTPAVQRPE